MGESENLPFESLVKLSLRAYLRYCCFQFRYSGGSKASACRLGIGEVRNAPRDSRKP